MAIGGACPEPGELPADVEPDGHTLFVSASTGAASDGNGSRDAPFGTPAEAFAAARAGSTILLSVGEHTVSGPAPPDVVIRGACASGTIVVGLADDSRPVFGPIRGSLAVESLTIRATGRSALRIGMGGEASLSGVVMEVEGALAMSVDGGELVAEDVVIRGHGGALDIRGGVVVLERAAFATTGSAAIEQPREVRLDEGRLSLTDVSFRGPFGSAVVVESGALDARRLVIEGHQSYAIRAEHGALVTLQHFVARGPLPTGEHDGGGILIWRGARAVLDQTLLDGVREYGIRMKVGAELEATDTVIRDTRSRIRDARQGMGLSATGNSRVLMTRVALLRNQEAGVWCLGSDAVLNDVEVVGTEGEDRTGEAGYGILSADGCRLTLTRACVDDNRNAGVAVRTAAFGDISDLWVTNTRSSARTLAGGRGIHVDLGGIATVRRARAEGNVEVGISVDGIAAELELEDVTVSGTRGRDHDGRFGGGISVSGGRLTATRVGLEHNRYVGVYVGEAGEASIEHLRVQDTTPQDCASESCSDSPFGIGLGAFQGGRLRVADFTVDGAALCGVMVAEGSDLDLRSGSVSDSLVGACVQADPFDLERLTDEVAYGNNEQNLDATSLPVPEAVPPIDE